MAKKKTADKTAFEKCGEAIRHAMKREFDVDDFLHAYRDDIYALNTEFKMPVIAIAKLMSENGCPVSKQYIKPHISKIINDRKEVLEENTKKEDKTDSPSKIIEDKSKNINEQLTKEEAKAKGGTKDKPVPKIKDEQEDQKGESEQQPEKKISAAEKARQQTGSEQDDSGNKRLRKKPDFNNISIKK